MFAMSSLEMNRLENETQRAALILSHPFQQYPLYDIESMLASFMVLWKQKLNIKKFYSFNSVVVHAFFRSVGKSQKLRERNLKKCEKLHAHKNLYICDMPRKIYMPKFTESKENGMKVK